TYCSARGGRVVRGETAEPDPENPLEESFPDVRGSRPAEFVSGESLVEGSGPALLAGWRSNPLTSRIRLNSTSDARSDAPQASIPKASPASAKDALPSMAVKKRHCSGVTSTIFWLSAAASEKSSTSSGVTVTREGDGRGRCWEIWRRDSSSTNAIGMGMTILP